MGLTLLINLLTPTENLKPFIEDTERKYFDIYTGWNDKIVVLKKTTLQHYLKTFIEKINSGNLIM